MRAEPLVSLIMPAWRPNPSWLRQAVESALTQSHTNVELLLIDDGSPDPVAPLFGGLRDPRLRLVRTGHGGVSNARNAGLAQCSGEWVRFIDCDDVLPPHSTATLLKAASEASPIVYGATLVCDENLRPVGKLESRMEGDVRAACLRGRLDIMLPAMLFRRDVVEAAGAFDASLSVMEDFDFALRTFACAPVKRSGEVVYLYRRHSASAMATASIGDSELAWRAIIDGFFGRHPELATPSLKREVEASMLLDSGGGYFAAGDFRAGMDRLSRAFTRAPLRALASLPRLARAARLQGD